MESNNKSDKRVWNEQQTNWPKRVQRAKQFQVIEEK